MLSLHTTRSFSLLTALALAACAETNRPGQPTEAGPSPFEHASPLEGITALCEEGTSTDVALDEVTDAGFSAEDMLAYAEGEHREMIRWLMPEDLRVGPESDAREITIAVERASDRAQELRPDTDVIGHGARCRPWITVDVIVTIQSRGGALNERFEATLFANDPRVAYLRATTPTRELAGALSVTRESMNVTASSYELKMTLSEHGATGSLYSRWSRQYMETLWDESFEIAHWGRARCSDGSYAVELDAPVELWSPEARASANDGIAWLNAAEPITIQWVGGGATTATFSFAATDGGACVAADTLSAELFQDLRVSGELELRTDDGRVDARWPGTLSVDASEDDAVIGAAFLLDVNAMPDGYTASTAELGFPDERRGGHTNLQARCDLFLSATGEHSGVIELNAYDDAASCDVLDPGCVSMSTFTPLVRGDVVPEP